MPPTILVTICARGGSKGVPSKNIRPFLGKPLIAYTIEQARAWGKGARIVISSDSEEILKAARAAGAETPFVRPAELATDSAGKVPVISHALRESERIFGQRYDVIVDLDPTCPVRRPSDIEMGLKTFLDSSVSLCLSVTKARKNPYFNQLERDGSGRIQMSKKLEVAVLSRQKAPAVWDINGSVYVYGRDFLLSNPASILDANLEIFETPPETAFDIDEERDFAIAEAMAKIYLK